MFVFLFSLLILYLLKIQFIVSLEEGFCGAKSIAPRQRKSEAVTMQEVTAKKRNKLQRANGFESENFTYNIVMKRTHVVKSYDIVSFTTSSTKQTKKLPKSA